MTDVALGGRASSAPTSPAIPPSLYACIYRPAGSPLDLTAVAKEFSPRYQRCGDAAILIDVRGLERLLGAPRVIAMRRPMRSRPSGDGD